MIGITSLNLEKVQESLCRGAIKIIKILRKRDNTKLTWPILSGTLYVFLVLVMRDRIQDIPRHRILNHLSK